MAVDNATRAPRAGAHPLLVIIAFVINMMTIALSFWNIGGAPVRTMVALAALVFCIVLYQRAFLRALALHRRMLLLILGFALLGTVVSVLNGTDVPTVARQVAAIDIQGAVILILSAILVEVCGPAAIGWAFIAAVGVTTIVAILQFVDIGAAWDIRHALGVLQKEVFAQYDYFTQKRPMGLSFSPITLATQICLSFAAFGVLREHQMEVRGRRRRIDLLMLAAVAAFLFACISSGNRSPILGIILFSFLYIARQKRAVFWAILFPIAVVLLVAAGPFLLDSLQQSSLRVAQVGDKSSAGRETLLYYGGLLFINHPFGYGLDFDPTRYWRDYWGQLQNMPNAVAIQAYPLHDYVLSMLNFYGIGILLLLPLIVSLFKEYSWTLLFFVPYIMHILFHNAGPFFDDPLIWVVFAVAAGLKQRLPAVGRSVPKAAAPTAAARRGEPAFANGTPAVTRVVPNGRS